MPYPTHKLRITASTYATVEYLNEIQDNVKAMVYDVYHAKGQASSFNAKLKQLLTTGGNIKANVIRHANISNITPDQHHLKYHAGSHTDGVDNIQAGTSTVKGLVTATIASKINTIASKATRMQIATYAYRGNNVASGQYISLGFRPLHVMIFYDEPQNAGTAGFGGKYMTETLWGCSHSWRHQIEWANDGGIEHRSKPVGSSVRITTLGLKVFKYLNITNCAGGIMTKYHVLAYRGD